MDNSTLFYRNIGKCPDMYWYAVNGKSPQENLEEQHEKIKARLAKEGEAEDTYIVYVNSEVKII